MSTRRDLLKNTLLAGAGLIVTNVAEAAPGQCSRAKTPIQPEGPFYPIVDQLDKDNDLIRVQGSTEIAKGQVVIVQGFVRDQNCEPVVGALVEIWQACHTGRYNHQSDPNTAPLDPNFQYWGKAVTNARGQYRFRTIVPGAYPAGQGWVRPPHIHFKVSKLGYLELITQMYFAGHSLNSRDQILRRLPQNDQAKVIVNFNTQQGLPHPVGQFDIVMEKVQ